jgi:hypothetical protein
MRFYQVTVHFTTHCETIAVRAENEDEARKIAAEEYPTAHIINVERAYRS